MIVYQTISGKQWLTMPNSTAEVTYKQLCFIEIMNLKTLMLILLKIWKRVAQIIERCPVLTSSQNKKPEM